MSRSPAERALAAEVRAVEEGHTARRGDGCFLVRSDSRPLDYQVRIHGYTGSPAIYGTCTCPAGEKSAHGRQAIPCKHVANVMRRGEREGWARWDAGRWVVDGPLTEAVA